MKIKTLPAVMGSVFFLPALLPAVSAASMAATATAAAASASMAAAGLDLAGHYGLS